MLEVHRSFVNSWECDENEHMNVQFYMRRFEEGMLVFSAMHPQFSASRLLRRHVRFHRELLEGDSTLVQAGIVTDGRFAGSLLQCLYNADTLELCTTALDRLENPPGADAATQFSMPSLAEPKGLADDEGPQDSPDALADMLQGGQAMVSNHSILRGGELATDGRMRTDSIVSRFTDSASHIWKHAGISTGWLGENGCGRVSVELKANATQKAEPGSVLRLVSRADNRKGKTFRIVHALQTLPEGKIIARGEVCCVVMNLKTRKATDLPDSFTALQPADPVQDRWIR